MKKSVWLVLAAGILLAGCNDAEQSAGDKEQQSGNGEEHTDADGGNEAEENGSDNEADAAEREEQEAELLAEQERIAELEAEIERLTEEAETGSDSEETSENGSTTGEENEYGRSAPRMTPDEDFFTQFWFIEEQSPEEEEMGFEPSLTDWQDYRGEISNRYSAEESGYMTAEVLAMDWIRERETEMMMDTQEELAMRTYYEEDGESAMILILHWGLKDDAIAGEDLLLHLTRNGDIWSLDNIEERYYCRRGMDEDASICH
ncbi:hypothetical protein CR205_10160 [Alteribacter lacisalsi]|uniref:Uncharacterized protein n=1 Tax=Alteribacter lacisalsi TaxID=2045244 RepID=A0A2W0HPW8_9BACI|nr:hypothetical protein [Alteribacter lacisalsi]PYZ98909.1 hypothetical protein CR205_10160 [Alteribacter lacisalsi]